MKKLVFGLLSLTLLATACKKDKDAPAITKENIAGSYKLTSATVSTSNSAEVMDVYAAMDACQKDDIYKLNADANSTFEYQDAGTQCDPPGDWSDSWSLNGNVISFYDQAGTITKFDGSNMEITTSSTEQGVTTTYKANFKKQ